MRKKILIVDDDRLVRYGLAKALRNEAIDVKAVATATTALEQISSCPFDLCLVDIHLADFCGIELMQRIKAACPEIRCIVMTASCADHRELSETMRRVAEITGCHFLPKPFDLNEMRDLVLLVLQGTIACGNQAGDSENEMLRSRRKSARRPWHEQLFFVAKAMDNDDTIAPLLMAVATDISDNGIGILCDTALDVDQTLMFSAKLAYRTGSVAWSAPADNGQCQAGIQLS